jgi:hypothetical protein
MPQRKRNQPITIITISWLMLLKEIIAVYSENNMNPISTFCLQNAELFIVKGGGLYRGYLINNLMQTYTNSGRQAAVMAIIFMTAPRIFCILASSFWRWFLHL